MMSLCYLPTAGRLTLTIVKARNLKAMDITGASGKNQLSYNMAKCLSSSLTVCSINFNIN